MGSYYYLASQLPYLSYGQSAPMSSAVFRELARPLLQPEDAALLDEVALDPGGTRRDSGDESLPSYGESALPSGCGFIDRWREWERAVRLNLARRRGERLRREGGAGAEPPIYPADAVAVAVKAVAAAESPLEAELALDKARWDAIEDFQGIEYFDRNTIFAYLLKLLLLERRAAFHAEAGFAEYKSLYAAILGGVQENLLQQAGLPGQANSVAGEPK